MNRADENGVPEALRHYGLALDEINLGQVLEALNPNTPPLLGFLLCNLSLLSTEPLMKNCSKSDVNPQQGRFLLTPQGHVRNHILPYLYPNEDPSTGIPVRVYHTNGTHYYPLLFKQRNNRYVITHRGLAERTRWRNVCDAIQLRERDPIKAWILRHSETNELCFYIAKLVKE